MDDLESRLREVTGGKLHCTNTPNSLRLAAADRIEELTKERDEQIDWVKRLADDLIAAEAKLAKAVETISLCRKMQAQFAHTEDPLMVLIDTTIAERKGQNDE